LPESRRSTDEFGNKRVAQILALAFAISGVFLVFAYSPTAAVVVWVLAVVFVIGSFFIERDF
jgi:uncharacterized membrane protein